MNRLIPCSVTFAACLACGVFGFISRVHAADEEKKASAPPSTQPMGMDPKMMEMMQKMMTPGRQHELLKQTEGNWRAEVKYRFNLDAPEQTSIGSCKNEMIFGGRYLKQDYRGEFMGQPFQGMGLIGFDNARQKYCASWADEMSTGILYCEGVVDDAGKVFTFTGEYFDPMSGKNKTLKQVLKVIDPDKHVCEWYEQGADGKEYVGMLITYTRQKG
jgi:hypothetical protein